MKPVRRKRRHTRLAAGSSLIALLALLGFGSSLDGCTPKSVDGPNVLIVVIDTLRADRVGAYGAERETSPYLDSIAREGVLFENPFTVAPSTWQSFTSILTGLIPPHHGVRFIFDDPLSADHATLPGLLRGRGYRTASFDAETFMREMTGGRLFETYMEARAKDRPVTDRDVMSLAASWIKAQKQGPWFAFVRIGQPHWPYKPDPAFHDLFASDEGIDHSFNRGNYGVRLVPDESGQRRLEVADEEAFRKLVFDVDMPPAMKAHMIAHYDACVRTTDDALAQELGRVPDLEDALIVITSDHGEGFGDHGYRGHGPGVDDEVMRVPLIFRFPAKHAHGKPGQRIEQVVRTVDIMPTVLATIGIDVPAGLDGRSLLPAIDAGTGLDLTAYGESDNQGVAYGGRPFIPGVPGKQRMLRTQRWKIRYAPDGKGGEWTLYDMQGQGDARDVAADNPAELAALRQQLQAILDADPDQAAGSRRRALSAEEKERLRVLGYHDDAQQ